MNLAEVYDEYRGDPAFVHLRGESIKLVPGEGSSRPRVIIWGEAPGATENTAQRPFTGAAGRILRSLISDCAGLDAEDYFLSTVVKYWPTGGRQPRAAEIEASRPYLRKEWAALGRPDVMVAVGAVARSAIVPDASQQNFKAAGVPIASTNGLIRWVMIDPRYGTERPELQPRMEQHWESFGDWFRKEYL